MLIEFTLNLTLHRNTFIFLQDQESIWIKRTDVHKHVFVFFLFSRTSFIVAKTNNSIKKSKKNNIFHTIELKRERKEKCWSNYEKIDLNHDKLNSTTINHPSIHFFQNELFLNVQRCWSIEQITCSLYCNHEISPCNFLGFIISIEYL